VTIQETKDLTMSFALINFINAILQGRFTGLNVLAQFGQASQGELEKVTKQLDQVLNWRERVLNGESLLRAEWTKPETEEARLAFAMIEELKLNLEETAKDVTTSLALPDLQTARNALVILIAAFARYTYSMDNHIRGQLDFALKCEKNDLAHSIKQQLEKAEEDVQLANNLVQEFIQGKDGKEISLALVERLRMECRFADGVFRAQAIDATSIIYSYTKDVSFADFGFMQLEEQVWQNAHLTPLQAAYWNAYAVPASEVLSWIRSGVVEPLVAAKWRTLGMGPSMAPQWMGIAFPPLLALVWAKAGYTPQQAALYVDQGVLTPDQVGQGK
jgi:hypothetical protein